MLRKSGCAIMIVHAERGINHPAPADDRRLSREDGSG
jgi:hypothetical protein